MSRYIIVEDFNDTVNLVVNEEGEVLIFTNPDDAILEACECQNPIIVDLDNKIQQFSMFRILNSDENKDFRQWARDNYEIGTSISSLWHPVIKDECDKINKEYESKTISSNS